MMMHVLLPAKLRYLLTILPLQMNVMPKLGVDNDICYIKFYHYTGLKGKNLHIFYHKLQLVSTLRIYICTAKQREEQNLCRQMCLYS